jgi:hypothetical protein
MLTSAETNVAALMASPPADNKKLLASWPSWLGRSASRSLSVLNRKPSPNRSKRVLRYSVIPPGF